MLWCGVIAWNTKLILLVCIRINSFKIDTFGEGEALSWVFFGSQYEQVFPCSFKLQY